MKELKISVSDELYEELSTVPDKNSFVIELLEDRLKVSAGNNAAEVTGEELPEEAYSEFEDAFEEEGSSPVENVPSFQRMIVDLADCIREIEKQISDMGANVAFLKDRSVLSDIGEKTGEAGSTSAAGFDSIVPESPDGAVPYATLSFPELTIPPELLSDAEGLVAEIEQDDVLESPVQTQLQNVADTTVAEALSPESFTKPLLFDAEGLPETTVPTPDQELISFSEGETTTENIGNGNTGNYPSRVTKPETPVSDVIAPVADRLESCIFAYLRSGSEVKKDVIKSLLSRRYPDSEVESKIDQLLSAGRISNIVKDGRVYLIRLPEKESA